MFEFLSEHKILTFTLIGTIFSTMMITSMKSNLVEPFFEMILPSSKLDFNNDNTKKIYIKWQTFLRDLLVWFSIIFIIYLLYLINKTFLSKK